MSLSLATPGSIDPSVAYPHTAPVLRDLAVAIAGAFPEVEDRAFAVSEWDLTAENVPSKFPICVLALGREQYDWGPSNNSSKEKWVSETVIVKFLMQPERMRRADGSESPFWRFYDYSEVRDRCLDLLEDYRSPSGGRIIPQSLDIGADQLAVELTFTLMHRFKWCAGAKVPLVAAGQMRPVLTLLGPPETDCCTCPDAASTVAAATSANCP